MKRLVCRNLWEATNMSMLSVVLTVAAIMLAVTLQRSAFAAEPSPAERVISLKAHLAESLTVLRQYEWTETTGVNFKGAEMPHKIQRCSYSADGKTIRKEPLPGPKKNGSVRSKIAAAKEMKGVNREDLTRSLLEAEKLIHQYIPLNLNGLTAVEETGTLSFSVTAPGNTGRLTIKDFLKRGDRVELDLDITNNRPLSLKIYSFLDSAENSVILSVTLGSLYGNAIFARETVLESKGQQLKVAVTNSDYRSKTAR